MLIRNLPPEAMVWRIDSLPFAEDVAATTLERMDAWGNALAGIMAGQKVKIPGQIEVQRPGQEAETKKPMTDRAEVAQFFRNRM